MANGKQGRPLKYPWDRLKLKGKSYFMRGFKYAKVYPMVRAYGIRHNKQFKVWTVPNGVNVRRIG